MRRPAARTEYRYRLMHQAPQSWTDQNVPQPASSLRSPSQSRVTEPMSHEHDPSAPLSRDTGPVFDAITALLSHCPDEDDASLRPFMRTLVAEARSAGVHAEILLRLLKEGWRSLPDQLTAEERLKRAESLNRVVSLCIREFYRADGC